jgi:hypothetical protein
MIGINGRLHEVGSKYPVSIVHSGAFCPVAGLLNGSAGAKISAAMIAVYYIRLFPNFLDMDQFFPPFTPEKFHEQTGLVAMENEAVYIRWVNTQINYANFQSMKEMTASLKEIIGLLQQGDPLPARHTDEQQ